MPTAPPKSETAVVTEPGWNAPQRLLRGRLGVVLPLVLLLLAAGFFRFYLYSQGIANQHDVAGYLFAAETFARGKLKAPVPPPDHPGERISDEAPQFFRTFGVVPHSFNDRDADGRKYRYMYSRYLPGHPLVLFIGKMVLRTYALVPLALVLLSAVGIYLILRITAGETAARTGLWLPALSPFFLAFGCSLLSHNSTFLFLTGGTLAYILMDRAAKIPSRLAWGLAAGFLYGWAVTCRPLVGLCLMVRRGPYRRRVQSCSASAKP